MTLSKANEKFDTCLEALDWRYSAAIVGLCKYLTTIKMSWNMNFPMII